MKIVAPVGEFRKTLAEGALVHLRLDRRPVETRRPVKHLELVDRRRGARGKFEAVGTQQVPGRQLRKSRLHPPVPERHESPERGEEGSEAPCDTASAVRHASKTLCDIHREESKIFYKKKIFSALRFTPIFFFKYHLSFCHYKGHEIVKGEENKKEIRKKNKETDGKIGCKIITKNSSQIYNLEAQFHAPSCFPLLIFVSKVMRSLMCNLHEQC